jgi:hypothetical protein
MQSLWHVSKMHGSSINELKLFLGLILSADLTQETWFYVYSSF